MALLGRLSQDYPIPVLYTAIPFLCSCFRALGSRSINTALSEGITFFVAENLRYFFTNFLQTRCDLNRRRVGRGAGAVGGVLRARQPPRAPERRKATAWQAADAEVRLCACRPGERAARRGPPKSLNASPQPPRSRATGAPASARRRDSAASTFCGAFSRRSKSVLARSTARSTASAEIS